MLRNYCLIISSMFLPIYSWTQCAMCKVNAESASSGGNQQASWINFGILFLMFVPLLLMLAIYLLWRRNNVDNNSH